MRALVVALATLALGSATAQAATLRVPATGIPNDLALAGDALVVLPTALDGGTIAPLRVLPGQPLQPVPVVGTKVGSGTEEGDLAATVVRASAAALAVSAVTRDPELARVWVGPAAGPLRPVASCTTTADPSPVAVDGTRIGWVEGGCTRRAGGAATAATVVIADVDPAVPVRRFPLPANSSPTGLSLGAAGDRVLYQQADSPDEVVLATLAADGTTVPRVLAEPRFGYQLLGAGPGEATYLADVSTSGSDAAGCRFGVRRLLPGAEVLDGRAQLGTLPGGSCLAGEDPDAAGGGFLRSAVLAGDGLVVLKVAPGSKAARPRGSVARIPLAGGPATTLLGVRGRRPNALTADGARIAYAVQSCGTEDVAQLVVTDEVQPALAECSVRITGTTVRRTGEVTGSIAVDCPIGCRVSSTADPGSIGADDSVRRGRGRVLVNLPARLRPGARVTVSVAADDGPTVTRRVRVVRGR